MAGAEPGVLLAPAVVLVSGVGAGARVLDGRALQPGKGAARPRGYKSEAEIPEAARIGVPRSLGLLAHLHGARGRSRMADLVKAGVSAAEDAGATKRAALIAHVGRAGPLALRSEDAAGALLAAAGPVAGGILTAEDLDGAVPDDVPARATSLAGEVVAIEVPWDAPLGRLPEADAILACDARGLVAVMVYVPTLPEYGVRVPELELVLGRHAHPVRRGVPRTAPGTPLEMPAPAAIVQKAGFFAAVALPGKAGVDVAALARLAEGWPAESALAELREQTGATAAMALLRDARDARAVTSQ
jgi:gamma-glutamyltranspeptidase/glutathione hydrolase